MRGNILTANDPYDRVLDECSDLFLQVQGEVSKCGRRSWPEAMTVLQIPDLCFIISVAFDINLRLMLELGM